MGMADRLGLRQRGELREPAGAEQGAVLKAFDPRREGAGRRRPARAARSGHGWGSPGACNAFVASSAAGRGTVGGSSSRRAGPPATPSAPGLAGDAAITIGSSSSGYDQDLAGGIMGMMRQPPGSWQQISSPLARFAAESDPRHVTIDPCRSPSAFGTVPGAGRSPCPTRLVAPEDRRTQGPSGLGFVERAPSRDPTRGAGPGPRPAAPPGRHQDTLAFEEIADDPRIRRAPAGRPR